MAGRAGTPPRRERELVEAAVTVFSTRGYAESTVQDVADELGILKGSLYHYIRTKEDLLFRLYEDVHREIDGLLRDIVATPGLTPLGRLDRYVRDIVAFNGRNLPLVSIYHHEVDRLSPERRDLVLDWQRPHQQFVADSIRDAQAAGEAEPDGDPAILAMFVFATMVWTYRWYKPGRSPVADLAEGCASFAALGIRGTVNQGRTEARHP